MKWFERSLLHLILLLLAVSLVSFLLVSMSPVDPLQTNVGQTALGSMAPEQIEKLQAYWGVGVPVWKRFLAGFRASVMVILAFPFCTADRCWR